MHLVRRPVAWVRRWHGGQLATLWAACTVGPWQILAWREALVAARLRAFLDPWSASRGGLETALGLIAIVLPLVALAATGVWLSSRLTRSQPGA